MHACMNIMIHDIATAWKLLSLFLMALICSGDKIVNNQILVAISTTSRLYIGLTVQLCVFSIITQILTSVMYYSLQYQ